MTREQFTLLQARLKQLFTHHPEQTGETYLQHFGFTLVTSLKLTWVGFILLLHGIFPFLFTHTASSSIEKLYLLLKTRIPKARLQTLDTEYNI
jgi:hypothetical protein